jgi:hypothetical protein
LQMPGKGLEIMALGYGRRRIMGRGTVLCRDLR